MNPSREVPLFALELPRPMTNRGAVFLNSNYRPIGS
jgi:hypothetical protein